MTAGDDSSLRFRQIIFTIIIHAIIQLFGLDAVHQQTSWFERPTVL